MALGLAVSSGPMAAGCRHGVGVGGRAEAGVQAGTLGRGGKGKARASKGPCRAL
jgi:hypothetical protein